MPASTRPFHTACVRIDWTPAGAGPDPSQGPWLEAVGALAHEPLPWWLDSALSSPRLGRFSFAGSDPYLVVRARGRRVEVECRRPVRSDLPVGRRIGRSFLEGEPLEVLASLLPPAPPEAPAGLPFVGGAVGYLGYELVAGWESLDLRGLDDLALPDLAFLLVDRLIAFDHLEGRIQAVGLGFDEDPTRAQQQARQAAEQLRERVGEVARRASPVREAARTPRQEGQEPNAFFDQSSYEKTVERALERIEAGDVYQVCLTHRLEVPVDVDPWCLYQELRRLNPAPFGAYLALPEVSILSSSPELFLSLSAEGWAESRPIKGTRPRAGDPAADRALQRALAASEKDRAENLMIVDLVRNDLGRHCETGSVHVPELMVIEPYATVFQMVSAIRGRLRPDRNLFDLVRAAFPPGSMTGAPKIAAMEILQELEPVRRGIYSGALGYLDVRGGAALSVVIRTALVTPGKVHVHTGGGVVADSDPAAEWEETWDKARALLEAISVVARREPHPRDAASE